MKKSYLPHEVLFGNFEVAKLDLILEDVYVGIQKGDKLLDLLVTCLATMLNGTLFFSMILAFVVLSFLKYPLFSLGIDLMYYLVV